MCWAELLYQPYKDYAIFVFMNGKRKRVVISGNDGEVTGGGDE